MKKIVLGGSICLGILVAALLGFFLFYMRPVMNAETAVGFAHGLKEYAVDNSLMLPEKWSDYMVWYKKKYPNQEIPDSILDGHHLDQKYRLRHRDLKSGSDTTIYVEILDPEIKGVESLLNRTLNSARYTEPMQTPTSGLRPDTPHL